MGFKVEMLVTLIQLDLLGQHPSQGKAPREILDNMAESRFTGDTVCRFSMTKTGQIYIKGSFKEVDVGTEGKPCSRVGHQIKKSEQFCKSYRFFKIKN